MFRSLPALFALALILSSCAPPKPEVAVPAEAHSPGAPVEMTLEGFQSVALNENLAGYDLTVTDFSANPSKTVGCALLRTPGKRPHVMFAYTDETPGAHVGGPFLIHPGSWDLPSNREMSDLHGRMCARSGITLPAY